MLSFGKKQILDSVTILNEVIDEAKKRNIEGIFFKIDFVKAYNLVECNFINLMMSGFGLVRYDGSGLWNVYQLHLPQFS